jgi:hypothetical protein
VCHGAAVLYDKEKKEAHNAYFLPFDLEHGIDYYSINPLNPLSRAAQEATFKRLNRIVATTDLYLLEHAKALLNGFYGAPEDFSNPAAWPSATFQNDWVPNNDWNASDDARQIYRKVVAPYCRTCHTSDPAFHFGTWGNFVSFQFELRRVLCLEHGTNIMPNAEATSKRFWRSDARTHFVSRMNAAGCGLESAE